MNRKTLWVMVVVLVMSVVILMGCKSKSKGGGVVSYPVGGTVSGLTGTGLVLQNNAGDDLVVTADGVVAFPTLVANGAAYAVTVKTQPSAPLQTCTVNNGAGTIAGAEITNVSIICSTNAYAVGGSVTGLAGTGLVLQNNDGDDLAISASGAFTFATSVADSAGYKVTVKTQPSGPSQTCTVNSGTGTIAGAEVISVSVICSVNAYTVGGSVSGLTVAGLVLQDNSGDDLALSASGAFTFATKVADGANYHVTVKTRPAGQICTVTNGAGTMAGADVTSISVVCEVANYAMNEAVSAVAVGPDGTTYLGGSFTRISEHPSGSGVPIDTGTGALATSFPKVNGYINAVASDGSGGWYIGGSFSSVGGVDRNYLAHILSNGSVDSAWNPDADADVYALAVSGSTVYAGGWFTTMGGTARNYLAAIGPDGTLGA